MSNNALIGAAFRAMDNETLASIARSLDGPARQALLIQVGAITLSPTSPVIDDAPSARKSPAATVAAPRRGRPAKDKTATAAPAKTPKASAKSEKAGETSTGRPAGTKRTADELVADTERVLQYITSSPIVGSEQIQRGTGMSKEDCTLPIKKLLATGKITAKGKKRATRYAVPSAWANAGAAPTVEDDSDDAAESTPAPAHVRGGNRVNGVARKVTYDRSEMAGADAE